MKLKTKLKVVAFVVLVGGAVSYALLNQKVQVEYKQEEIVPVVVRDEKANIRNRADIQKQQELIVEEAYLLEEKAKYETSLKDIETRLDAVRKEKVSFISAPRQSR